MKRIILTESQYKRLVRRPLNEEVSDEGEKVTDFNIELEGNNIRRWNDNNPEHVERIQKMLKSLNYDLGYYGPNGDGVDGIYGPFTEKAVEEFQENEMPNQPEQWDGIIGPITYEILKDSVKGLADEEGVEDDDLLNNDDVEESDDVEEFEFHGEGLTDEIPTILHELMYLISSKESKNHSYDSAYPSKVIDGLSEMTIEEATSVNGSSAVGRWQLMPKYMVSRAKKAGLKMSDKFSEVNQDKMAMLLIKGWERWSCRKFAQKLARIWAAVPVLYDQKGDKQQIKRGQSYYEGVQGNSAGIGVDEFEAAVRKTGCNGDIYKELGGVKSNGGRCRTSECQFRVRGGCKPFDALTPDSNMGGTGYGANFHKIPDGKTNFRSAALSAEQMLYALETYDIKNIISFDDGDDGLEMKNHEEKKFIKCYNESNGTNIKWTKISAHNNFKTGKGYVGTLDEVLPLPDNTLIHCTHGADRTGYVVAKHLKDLGKIGTNEELWDYTVKYNGWEGKGGHICKGKNTGYIKYLEGFYPHEEWCGVGNRMEDCPSCKKYK